MFKMSVILNLKSPVNSHFSNCEIPQKC